MVLAEFEEKEYEIPAAIELASGRSRFGHVFSPGQVLEGILGYDAAVTPCARPSDLDASRSSPSARRPPNP